MVGHWLGRAVLAYCELQDWKIGRRRLALGAGGRRSVRKRPCCFVLDCKDYNMVPIYDCSNVVADAKDVF